MALKDSNILSDLRGGNRTVLARLYADYRAEFIQWMTSKYSCDVEEAKDIYQQVIITFYENVVSEKLVELTSSLKTYLFSIGKNKYKAWLRHQKQFNVISPSLVEEPGEDKMVAEDRLKLIEGQLINLGEPCKSLLIQFYYHKQSVSELSLQFGYKNVASTKNQKYKCLERLRRLVLENESQVRKVEL